MSDALAQLEPRLVWDMFARITEIPRPSKHEARIAAWVRELAAQHDLPVRADATGNLVLDVPASAGHEQAPVVVLQAHLDMVCEKNDGTEHDFLKDPIRTRVDGEWVRAIGTTLGADNGLGVAAALAAATDPTLVHGPLQLLLTVDEETGLTGAANLDGALIDGRILLNLDSEEDGTLFVGCAGGADCHLRLPMQRCAPAAGNRALRLDVSGLQGGHSGLNIHEPRGNALKFLARALAAAIESKIDLQLVTLRGGRMHNAIPREAHAILRVSGDDERRLRAVLADAVEGFRIEARQGGSGLDVRCQPIDDDTTPWTADSRDRLLQLMLVLPHGVLAMSPDIPGLVETSCSLAVVAEQDDSVALIASGRSSIASAMDGLMTSLAAAGALAGCEVEVHDGYPGWQPRMDSPLLATVRQAYADVWGRDPEVTAVHAGLECGLLGQRVPDLDMISFGPQIVGAHSPDECAHVPSVGRFWQALRSVLEALAT